MKLEPDGEQISDNIFHSLSNLLLFKKLCDLWLTLKSCMTNGPPQCSGGKAVSIVSRGEFWLLEVSLG